MPTSTNSAPSAVPPSFDLEDYRKYATLTRDKVYNTQTQESASTFLASYKDNSFSLDSFKNNVKIEIKELTDETIEFDVIGIDAPLANSIRRVLISEIPTVAIENVCIYQNTGVLQDEYLAHRLGLIPLNIEPSDVDFVRDGEEKTGGVKVDKVHFTLTAQCDKDADGNPLRDLTVYAGDLKWTPKSEEERKAFRGKVQPRAIHDNIIVTRLARGQEIRLECTAVKGFGKDHAKWSPVGTAWYKLLPKVTLLRDIVDAEAEALLENAPPGMFAMENIPESEREELAERSEKKASKTKKKSSAAKTSTSDVDAPKKRAVLAPGHRNCNTTQWILDPAAGTFHDAIRLQKVKDHFIFRVEAIGQIRPEDLFQRALTEIHRKCAHGLDVMSNDEASPQDANFFPVKEEAADEDQVVLGPEEDDEGDVA